MKTFFIKTNLFQHHYINVYYYFIESLKNKLIKLNDYEKIFEEIISDSFINEKYKFLMVNSYNNTIKEKNICFIIYDDLFSINVKIDKTSYYINFR